MFAKARKSDTASGPVTREELDALRLELEALKRITATAVMALEQAGRYPGHGGRGSARQRLREVVAVATEYGLSAKYVASFNALIDEADHAERDREAAEEHARLDAQQHPWDANGKYRRRVI